MAIWQPSFSSIIPSTSPLDSAMSIKLSSFILLRKASPEAILEKVDLPSSGTLSATYFEKEAKQIVLTASISFSSISLIIMDALRT